MVAKSLSRRVGTPMHSAASSLSRSAASPRPIQERSMNRAASTETTARQHHHREQERDVVAEGRPARPDDAEARASRPRTPS